MREAPPWFLPVYRLIHGSITKNIFVRRGVLTKIIFINILRSHKGDSFKLKTVFIVDDSDTNLLMAEEALEDSYRVMTLPSAEKMFALLEKFTPDLILLDIEMPLMNGFDALEKLKTAGSWAAIPVIFLTGTINDFIREKSVKQGASGVISKPFSPSELLGLINQHI